MSARIKSLASLAIQTRQLTIGLSGIHSASRVLAQGVAILVAAACTDLTQPPSPAVSSADGVALAPSSSTTTVTVAIDPKSTFLRTEPNDVSQASLVLSLSNLGLKDGDQIRLEVVGNFTFSIHFPEFIDFGTESGHALIAVFSSTKDLLPPENLTRVPGAIDAGADFATQPTLFGLLPTDIAQDFNAEGVSIQIPPGAKYLFIGVPDSWYEDNADRNSDFGVRVTGTPAPKPPKNVAYSSLVMASQGACGLAKGGNAYCWGLNNVGQLGTGSTEVASAQPGLVAGNHRFRQIDHDYTHGCGIDGEDVYCWGSNDGGELGNPDAGAVSRTPVRVQAPFGFSQIAVGSWHTCGIRKPDGIGFCWGRGSEGELGNRTIFSGYLEPIPQQIFNYDPVGDPPKGFEPLRLYWIDAGSVTTCALSEGVSGNRPSGEPGPVKCWGWNGAGLFGDTPFIVNASAEPFESLLSLVPISVKLSLSVTHACALATQPSVFGQRAFCWGTNSDGELGNGTTQPSFSPILVRSPVAMTRISAGSTHSCGLGPQGEAYCWGGNDRGQLGTNTRTGSTIPLPVMGGIAFADIYAGNRFTCALTADGAAYCWGRNEIGELGDGTFVDRGVPTAVVAPSNP